MTWQAEFVGGPLDGTQRPLEGQPESQIIVCGGPLVPGFEDDPDHVVTRLLRPGEWARYQLASGAFPGPLRYQLAEEGPPRP